MLQEDITYCRALHLRGLLQAHGIASAHDKEFFVFRLSGASCRIGPPSEGSVERVEGA